MFTECCNFRRNGSEDCISWNSLEFPTQTCDFLGIALGEFFVGMCSYIYLSSSNYVELAVPMESPYYIVCMYTNTHIFCYRSYKNCLTM